MLIALVATGCANNPVAMHNQVQTLQQQQATLARQNQELQSRAQTLDEDNQELETLLAQARQQVRVLDDQLTAVREQLTETNSQLAQAKDDRQFADEQARARTASVRRRTGASISANSSLKDRLPEIRIPGVEVRQDMDVIRVELSGSKLFEVGGARLLPTAGRLITDVADELARAYPKQIIGVEGHTDSDPIHSGQWANNHQLSIGRAMAVYDHLVAHTQLRAEQLFIIGHGPNHPVVSNATDAGKERNRRVELVVYPETVP